MSNITVKDSTSIYINNSSTITISSAKVNIEYDFSDGDYVVLVFCDYDGNVELNEFGSIVNANVKINYLQLDKYDLKQNTKIDVNENSILNINTTYLSTNDKHIVFDLFNNKPDSIIEINNNIVCLKDAKFSLDCIGTIVKGAKRSKCHQKTHCLTVDSPDSARILPVLNIDENDVEASHSLSSGTIDEEILFYMNTRGLNRKEALNLIIKSYLMPNDNFYDDFELGKSIQEKAVTKVDKICLM